MNNDNQGKEKPINQTRKRSVKNDPSLDFDTHISERNRAINHGENCRHFRCAAGIKQIAIANELGLTQQRYSDLEQQSNIDTEILERIAKILGLDIKWLKDIPLVKSAMTFYQDGKGIYFCNTGNAAHTIRNSTEDLKEAHREALEEVKNAKDKIIEFLIADNKKLKEDLDKATSNFQNFLTSLGNIAISNVQSILKEKDSDK